MKGSEISWRKIIVIIICIVVAGVIISFLLKTVGSDFIDFISGEKKAYEECSRWASENYGEEHFTKNEYPRLYELYDGDAEKAKEFCMGKK